MKIKYPKSIMTPDAVDCSVQHEAYAEQFADEEDVQNIVRVYVHDECLVDGCSFCYKNEAKKLRRVAKWLLKVADWLEPQKLYYSDMNTDKGAEG